MIRLTKTMLEKAELPSDLYILYFPVDACCVLRYYLVKVWNHLKVIASSVLCFWITNFKVSASILFGILKHTLLYVHILIHEIHSSAILLLGMHRPRYLGRPPPVLNDKRWYKTKSVGDAGNNAEAGWAELTSKVNARTLSVRLVKLFETLWDRRPINDILFISLLECTLLFLYSATREAF